MTDLSIRPEQKPKPYMTVIPGRSPRQKLHANLGQAKNAAMYQLIYTNGRYVQTSPGRSKYVYDRFIGRDVAIYEWNSSTQEWVLLHELRKGDEIPWRKNELAG